MIILEIILTIIAWIRGWRWKALLPLGSVLVIGFIVGAIMGTQGYTIDDIQNQGWIVFIEVIGFLAMLIMAIVPPKEIREAKKKEKNETT